MVLVRKEALEDYSDVYDVNTAAFGRESEAKLVEAIRKSDDFINELSFVAEDNGMIIGHILFSPIVIEGSHENIPALALAPIAVKPEFQNTGIGSTLIKRGLEECKRQGHKVVVVLGHPEYYPRFGFVTAKTKGITAPFPVPDEAFMVYMIDDSIDAPGVVKYPEVFMNV